MQSFRLLNIYFEGNNDKNWEIFTKTLQEHKIFNDYWNGCWVSYGRKAVIVSVESKLGW